jgi:hypothetical protein
MSKARGELLNVLMEFSVVGMLVAATATRRAA